MIPPFRSGCKTDVGTDPRGRWTFGGLVAMLGGVALKWAPPCAVRQMRGRPASRVASRDFTSEQFRREGRNLLRPLSQAPGTVSAK